MEIRVPLYLKHRVSLSLVPVVPLYLLTSSFLFLVRAPFPVSPIFFNEFTSNRDFSFSIPARKMAGEFDIDKMLLDSRSNGSDSEIKQPVRWLKDIFYAGILLRLGHYLNDHRGARLSDRSFDRINYCTN